MTSGMALLGLALIVVIVVRWRFTQVNEAYLRSQEEDDRI